MLRALLLIAFIFFDASGFAAAANQADFLAGRKIVLKDPLVGNDLDMFGKAWKTATFVANNGQSQVLFPLERFNHSGGVVFDSDQASMSASGRYAVFSALRVGIVESGPRGKPVAESRQYCPVINTTSGCILSNNTGEICGGNWDSHRDEWYIAANHESSTDSMIKYQFLSASKLWADFLSNRTKTYQYKLKDSITDNLGVNNMLACEPLSAQNIDAYKAIYKQLNIEGVSGEGVVLSRALSKFNDRGGNQTYVATINQKAFLFDKPDPKFITKAYLLKNDEVRVLDKQSDDWVLIKYTTAGGKVLVKWIGAETLGERVER